MAKPERMLTETHQPGFIRRALRALLRTAFLIAILGAIVWGVRHKVGSPASPAHAKRSARAGPAIPISSMADEFQRSQPEAARRYQDKSFRVAATVQRVVKNLMGDQILYIGDGPHEDATADLADDQGETSASVKAGDQVVLTCAGADMRLGALTLNECRIQ